MNGIRVFVFLVAMPLTVPMIIGIIACAALDQAAGKLVTLANGVVQ